MQKYRCFKEVWAFKIKEVRTEVMPKFSGPTCRGCFALNSACGHCERCRWEASRHMQTGSANLMPEREGQVPVYVSRAFVDKHKPEAGGYYVRYDDGYESFSPAKAFEGGYEAVQV